MKNGWSFSSMTSTSLPSGERPLKTKPGLLEFLAVGVVEFVAVAVAFVDDERAVKLRRLRADHQLAGLRAQPHRAAFLGDAFSARRAWR